ncbi:cytochrome c [Virgibacillus sp. 179-BFC.A HS]|uniref:Cytochrome c n=1 Tax=Tigheibacillus jepli TaxID=3035914 RepID=A0ABU5CJ73_9BACI|nr:cytochrome c [Virgibacillus sp. 179-BFC.A HS]MDY0405550.1 cytochrome c [Virgibacillus sp. 179-BFC.A HS]
MKKNPVVPYAIIAIIGILAVIVLSTAGVGQRQDIQKADKGGEKTEQQAKKDEGGSQDPNDIFQANCAACHGADLTGQVGPNLTKIGAELSADDIVKIIHNGKGNMPAQSQVGDDEAKTLAKWLSEKK